MEYNIIAYAKSHKLVSVPSTDLSQRYWQESHMFLDTKCKVNGSPFMIVVRRETQNRLSNTCFRGKHLPLAGNFFAWKSPDELFDEKSVIESFAHEIREAIDEGARTNSFCFDFGSPIGWSGTDDVSNYTGSDLQPFQPNQRSKALRIDPEQKLIRAPLTSWLTIVYELKHEKKDIVAIVHSIYPGKDIGELVGNITDREKCVFFDWNHLGQPYP